MPAMSRSHNYITINDWSEPSISNCYECHDSHQQTGSGLSQRYISNNGSVEAQIRITTNGKCTPNVMSGRKFAVV